MNIGRPLKILGVFLVLALVAGDASAGLFPRRRQAPQQQQQVRRVAAPRQRQVVQQRPQSARPRQPRETLQQHLNKVRADSALGGSSKPWRTTPVEEKNYPTRVLKSQNSSSSVLVS